MLVEQATSDRFSLTVCLEVGLNSSRDFSSCRLLPDSLLVYSAQRPGIDGCGL
jgi:hypothetical protein